jgi:uncharacterized Zn-binding protein involved in type VI secretion
MPDAARKTDMHKCGIALHGVNAIAGPCCDTVQIGGLLAARVGDLCACGAPIAKGSATVLIGGQFAARKDDVTGHGGTIKKGETTVIIGDSGKGDGQCLCEAAAGAKALVKLLSPH